MQKFVALHRELGTWTRELQCTHLQHVLQNNESLNVSGNFVISNLRKTRTYAPGPCYDRMMEITVYYQDCFSVTSFQKHPTTINNNTFFTILFIFWCDAYSKCHIMPEKWWRDLCKICHWFQDVSCQYLFKFKKRTYLIHIFMTNTLWKIEQCKLQIC